MLANKFKMKDLADFAYVIVGIKYSKTLQLLVLSQSYYVGKMLEKYIYKKYMSCIVIGKTPIIDASLHLGTNNGDSVTPRPADVLAFPTRFGATRVPLACLNAKGTHS